MISPFSDVIADNSKNRVPTGQPKIPAKVFTMISIAKYLVRKRTRHCVFSPPVGSAIQRRVNLIKYSARSYMLVGPIFLLLSYILSLRYDDLGAWNPCICGRWFDPSWVWI